MTFGKSNEGFIKKKQVNIKGFLSKNPGITERIAVDALTKQHETEKWEAQEDKVKRMFKRVQMMEGQFFGEESILSMIDPAKSSNWFQKMDESKVYDIQCNSMGAEVLMFNVWTISQHLKTESQSIKRLQQAYYQKIPRMRTFKPTYMDNYTDVMDNRQLKREVKFKNVITQSEPELISTVLPPEKLRLTLYQGRPYVEKRQQFDEAV